MQVRSSKESRTGSRRVSRCAVVSRGRDASHRRGLGMTSVRDGNRGILQRSSLRSEASIARCMTAGVVTDIEIPDLYRCAFESRSVDEDGGGGPTTTLFPFA